jgi:hypothetical protein
MYSRQEAARLRQEFWTSFGLYLSPVPSAEGEKVNWINYRTGEKHVAFRMQAENRTAAIGIEISHPDSGVQELFFEQFLQFKNLLQSLLGEEWIWQKGYQDPSGKIISRIYTEITGVHVLNKQDWPALISFFKPRIIALDEFWSQVRYGFEGLR